MPCNIPLTFHNTEVITESVQLAESKTTTCAECKQTAYIQEDVHGVRCGYCGHVQASGKLAVGGQFWTTASVVAGSNTKQHDVINKMQKTYAELNMSMAQELYNRAKYFQRLFKARDTGVVCIAVLIYYYTAHK